MYLSFFRLGKEKSAYQKEVIAQEAKIEKMKADGKDEYDIKKMVSCNTIQVNY